MLRVGFEPTIPVFERAKKFHALDRAVTLTSIFISNNPNRWIISYSKAYFYNNLYIVPHFLFSKLSRI
jgi:hypothetical protein